MVNVDLGYRIKQLSERISAIEERLKEIKVVNSEDEDWDNGRLMREWQICKRTAASYRKQGLGFYKRGGRIFYTPKQRSDFKKLQQ
ncbi:hypothetical protein [Maribellus mangrovi]|uniref:hypothetical protein n=1 Tax=Maribellus mangrovi TaxID=3133146 RepID=UPI0030EDCCAE